MDRIEKIAELKWMAVRTRPRCEKKFAEYCSRRGVTHYLPLRRSVRRYQRRTVVFMVPLFRGYVFVQVQPTLKNTLVESRQVAHVLVPDEVMEETLVGELNDLLILEQATVEGELMVNPEVQVGRPVLLRVGPLAGLHGIVTRRKNKARLSVNVELLGQSVSIETDVSEVELEC